MRHVARSPMFDKILIANRGEVALRSRQLGRQVVGRASGAHPRPQRLELAIEVRDLRDRIAGGHEAGLELGEEGRVLVRPSGTEPLVRVMVEASSDVAARSVADRLAGAVRSRFAG